MMASSDTATLLGKRDTLRCYDDFSGIRRCYTTSSWYDWGRWVALAAIVLAVFAGLFFACLNNRRRRRRGASPMYGTGWIPTPGVKPPQNNYYPNQPYNGGAAPPYSPPIGNQPTGNTFNSNDGYYGQNHYNQNPYGVQQGGIELQPPQHAYTPQRGGENVYEAPMGPPPGKDRIIR